MITTSKWVIAILLMMTAVVIRAQEDNALVPDGPAPVDSVVVDGDEVAVVVSGSLADGCIRLGEATQTVEDDTIRIELLTLRVQGLDCIQMLVPYEETIPIETDGLTPRGYVVEVNGVTADTLLVVTGEPDADSQAAESETDDLALATLDCPAAGEDTIQYIDQTGRYCFLYPAGYALDSPQPAVNVISGAAEMEGARPRLTIATAEADGRTLDDIVIENQNRFPEMVLTFAETTVGGQPALLTERIPGRTGNRQAFVIWKGTLYTLAAQPVDADFPAATEATNALWSQVMDTFTFYEDLSETALGESGVILTYPAAWALDEADGVYTLRRSPVSVLQFRLRDDLSTASIEALEEAILDQLLTSGEGDLTFEVIAVAGQDAVEVSGLSDACRLLFIPDVAREEVLSIRVQEPDCDGSLNPIIDALRLREAES